MPSKRKALAKVEPRQDGIFLFRLRSSEFDSVTPCVTTHPAVNCFADRCLLWRLMTVCEDRRDRNIQACSYMRRIFRVSQGDTRLPVAVTSSRAPTRGSDRWLMPRSKRSHTKRYGIFLFRLRSSEFDSMTLCVRAAAVNWRVDCRCRWQMKAVCEQEETQRNPT